MMKEIFGQDL